MSKLTTNYGFSMPDVDDYVPDTINALAKTIESIDSNMNTISNKLSVQASTGVISIGSASASGSGSIAIGNEASSDAEGAIAIGRNARVSGSSTQNAAGSISIGDGAKALAENCVVIGGLVESNIDGEIILGRYRIIPGCITSKQGLTFEIDGETPVSLSVFYVDSGPNSYSRHNEYVFAYNSSLGKIDTFRDVTYERIFDITAVEKKIMLIPYDDFISNNVRINFVLKGFDIKNCSFS